MHYVNFGIHALLLQWFKVNIGIVNYALKFIDPRAYNDLSSMFWKQVQH